MSETVPPDVWDYGSILGSKMLVAGGGKTMAAIDDRVRVIHEFVKRRAAEGVQPENMASEITMKARRGPRPIKFG